MKFRRLGWQGLAAELVIAGAGAAWKHYQTREHARALALAPGLSRAGRETTLAAIDPTALVAALQTEGMALPAIGRVLATIGVSASVPAPVAVRVPARRRSKPKDA